eukprot:g3262.t1
MNQVFGESLSKRISTCKILVIGAGGIGCELLKNLALSGFRNVETIDLDTIDVSNLNRQFLFRKEHVGKSKANVAKEAMLRFNPDVNIIAHHGNVKSEKFNLRYFKQFTIVMNALDNIGARRHVNRLCLAANIPLVEAGSTGDLGQAYTIKKGVTECYECQPKAAPKKYPICTIRSTPSKPVHCIVWAKEFHKLMFGNTEESMLFEEDEADSVYMSVVKSRSSSQQDSSSYAKRVFRAIFHDEILKKIKMEKYKGADHPPEALVLEKLLEQNESMDKKTLWEYMKSFEQQRRVWSPSECANLLILCVEEILKTRSEEIGKCVWSKDDRLDLCFVTCASNLRSSIFSIPSQSSFKIKEIAGNIIPAIATTNAIVAGLQVLEAIKILRSLDEKDPDETLKKVCKRVWVNLRGKSRKGHMLMPSTLCSPNSNCYVCNTANVNLKIDTKKASFEHFLKAVLKARLGFNAPTVDIGDSTVWEEGEDAEDMSHNLKRILSEMGGGGIVDGAIVNVEDFSQDLEVQIVVEHVDEDSFDEEKNPLKFMIGGGKITPKPKKRARSENDSPGNSGSKYKKVCIEKTSVEEEELQIDEDGAIVMIENDDVAGEDGAIEII